MRKLFTTVAVAGLLLVGGPAFAANPPPSGATNQPNQSCQAQPSAPAGFGTAGFVHAELVYAGSTDSHSLVSGNIHAVAQYDVACFQVSQR